MRATVLHGPRDLRVEDVPDPKIEQATDAVVSVLATCVCGSDLWPYRGINEVKSPMRIGHEMVGVVEEVGPEVRDLKPGDTVIAPFAISCGGCDRCERGVFTSCRNGGYWGNITDGCQGELARVPLADSTLVPVPAGVDPALVPSLLTLSDVMGTGWHAAISASVRPGSTVAVVGDGAVGLCAVLSAVMLGADQVIAMSRYPARQALATSFGATAVVSLRGEEGAAEVLALTDGVGVDAALECVGTNDSFQQAISCVRPGGTVGYVGVPHGVQPPMPQLFFTNVNICGGVAPVRGYIERLLPQVLDGSINPGAVFDLTLGLEQVAQGYAAMDERQATKVLLRPKN